MRIAVLGTGIVGRSIAGRLGELGHDVAVGTRDPEATLAREEPDAMGNPPYAQWQRENAAIDLKPYAQAATDAELVVNATSGAGSLAALSAAGSDSLAGKVVLDVANPLDFSAGFPPTLLVANEDSLAEQIQREFSSARVVKSLNTMNCLVGVDPARVPGEHSVFLAGDDDDAKGTVKELLNALGWPAGSIIDLGGLRAARGLEMYLPLWLSLMQALGTGDFNIKVVRG